MSLANQRVSLGPVADITSPNPPLLKTHIIYVMYYVLCIIICIIIKNMVTNFPFDYYYLYYLNDKNSS